MIESLPQELGERRVRIQNYGTTGHYHSWTPNDLQQFSRSVMERHKLRPHNVRVSQKVVLARVVQVVSYPPSVGMNRGVLWLEAAASQIQDADQRTNPPGDTVKNT